ncbi:MAG: hypothetical protein K9L59_02600 [Desulfobacterales bacterium]|nr:hypothetical protein [Desulfobacterales bacterium]
MDIRRIRAGEKAFSHIREQRVGWASLRSAQPTSSAAGFGAHIIDLLRHSSKILIDYASTFTIEKNSRFF